MVCQLCLKNTEEVCLKDCSVQEWIAFWKDFINFTEAWTFLVNQILDCKSVREALNQLERAREP